MNTWTSAVFSPTGGCSKIATAIAGARMTARVDLCAPVTPVEVNAETPLLAVMPVYGGRLPAVAVQRLKALQGNGSPAIAVVVYGNRAYEDALLELRNTLTVAGFRVIAAAAFIAELNYYSNADGTSAILSPKAEAPEGTDADRLFNALDRSF